MPTVQQQKMSREKLQSHNTIRLVIADDRAPAREGLKAFLAAPNLEMGQHSWDQECLPIQVIGEASDGLQAVQMATALHPDVVIMDIHMPELDGIQATRMIKSQCKDVGVIILTIYSAHREDAMRAGADAFLLKGCPPETLIECLVKTRLKLGGIGLHG